MIQQFLLQILITVVAIDIVLAGVLIVFLINARIILKKQFVERQFEIRTILAAQQAASSEEAAKQLGMTTEEFENVCDHSKIDTPEQRLAKKEQAEKKKQAELRRIVEEEATWRAEQEKAAEQRRKEQEEETSKRKERLRKFGIT